MTTDAVADSGHHIRALHEIHGDRWWADLDPVLVDPELAEAYVRFAQVASRAGTLTAKERELILLAANASTTTLHVPSMRRHIEEALHHGATREEVIEIFELVSVLGIHSAHTGLPLLLEVLQESGEVGEVVLDPRQESVKEQYIARRGMWGEAMESMLFLDPELIAAYLEFSAVPWQKGHLSSRMKELVYIAIDGSITHLYHGGTRAHMERALQAGATREEVAAVLALIATMGVHALTAGFSILGELDGGASVAS